jgi:hypothetical protein
MGSMTNEPPSPPRSSPAEGKPPDTSSARIETDRPYSALDDIPGLPPFEPDMVDIEPSGFDLIWEFVRGIFSRKPHDRAA